MINFVRFTEEEHRLWHYTMTVTWRSRSCEVIEYPVVRVVGSVTNVIALCRERKLEKRCLHVWSWVYRSACLVVLLVIVWTSLLGATVFTPRSTAWHHAWADKVASSQAASTKQTSMRLFQSNTHLGVVSFCERFTHRNNNQISKNVWFQCSCPSLCSLYSFYSIIRGEIYSR